MENDENLSISPFKTNIMEQDKKFPPPIYGLSKFALKKAYSIALEKLFIAEEEVDRGYAKYMDILNKYNILLNAYYELRTELNEKIDFEKDKYTKEVNELQVRINEKNKRIYELMELNSVIDEDSYREKIAKYQADLRDSTAVLNKSKADTDKLKLELNRCKENSELIKNELEIKQKDFQDKLNEMKMTLLDMENNYKNTLNNKHDEIEVIKLNYMEEIKKENIRFDKMERKYIFTKANAERKINDLKDETKRKEDELNNEIISLKNKLLDMKHKNEEEIKSLNNLIKKMKENQENKLKTVKDHAINDIMIGFQKKEENLKQEVYHERLKAENIKKEYDKLKIESHKTVEKLKEKYNIEKLTLKNNFEYENKINNERIQKIDEMTKANLAKKEEECTELKNKNSKLEMENYTLKMNQLKFDKDIDQIKNEYFERVRSMEIGRRFHHNQLMDLKGNLRVFCRVRPILESENSLNTSGVFEYPDAGTTDREIVIAERYSKYVSYAQVSPNKTDQLGGSASDKKRINNNKFHFDRVFGPETSQEYIFDEVALLVQSAMDGYNVCIIAYGQTGSGKTYTMQGKFGTTEDISYYSSPSSESSLEDIGLNQSDTGITGRSLMHIFHLAKEKEKEGFWECTIYLSMIEIYCETIRDLLSGLSESQQLKCEIRGVHKDTYVTNVSQHTIKNEKSALKLLKKGKHNRITKKTNRNDKSSRSHCITTIKISMRCLQDDSESQESYINLVDLAGSENLNATGSGNDATMLKEAQTINKSLSAFGNVISALSKKQQHIPYRESKLTHILQSSITGDSKTLVILALSPLISHQMESINTLRLAKKISRVG